MNNTKLIRILNVCTKEEIKRIEKCIYSPFFNESEDICQLWQYLKNYFHKSDSPKLKKERIFAKLFANETYNDDKMRRLISALVKIIEKFWFLNSNNESFLFQQSLTQIYYEKYLPQEFAHQLQQLSLANEVSGKKNASYYENQVVIETFKMYAAFKRINIEKGKEDRNLFEVLKSRDRAYLIRQLELFCAYLNNSKMFNHGEKYKGFLEHIIIFYQNNYQNEEDVPILYMYLSIKKLLSQQSYTQNDIEELSQYLSKYAHLFHHNEIAYFAAVLRNVVNKKIHQDKSYKNVLFQLYKDHLQNGSLFNYGKILPDVFIRIVLLSLDVSEIEWIKAFITDYGHYIPKEQQESTRLFSNALLAFHLQAYQNALSYLIQTEKIGNPFFEVEIRVLFLKTYYHLNDFEALLLAENRLKAYIQRSTSLSKLQKKAYQNFLSLFQKISRHAPLSISQKNDLCKEIETMQAHKEKEWLLCILNTLFV